MSCSQCGYSMEPLDTVCRKCKGQGVSNAASVQTPPNASPYGQAPPLQNQTGQAGTAYQQPGYVPQAPQKSSGFSLNGNMVVGGLFCLFGIVATAWGFMSAAPGRSYTIFWGAIVFGAYRFFRGLTEG